MTTGTGTSISEPANAEPRKSEGAEARSGLLRDLEREEIPARFRPQPPRACCERSPEEEIPPDASAWRVKSGFSPASAPVASISLAVYVFGVSSSLRAYVRPVVTR